MGLQPAMEAMQQLIDRARVDAKAQAICSDQPFAKVLHVYSADAICAILGFCCLKKVRKLPGMPTICAWWRSYPRSSWSTVRGAKVCSPDTFSHFFIIS